MLDIPIGKTFTVVESNLSAHCSICDLHDYCTTNCDDIACTKQERKDHKNVIFKLVDYPISSLTPMGE